MTTTAASSITLSDLHIDCIVGIREREQRTPQPLIIEATMHLPLAAAATTGDLAKSVNYSAIADRLAFVTKHGQWGLLESLAHALCGLMILPPFEGESLAPLVAAEVCIKKPQALKGVAVPTVRMRREANSSDDSSPRTVCAGVTLDILAETPLGAAYRLRLASGASWPLPDILAAHVMAGSAIAKSGGDEKAVKPGDVLPRGSNAILTAGANGAAVLLVGPHRLGASGGGDGGGGAAAGSGASSAAGPTTAYIALGSNLGHRARYISLALDAMRESCGEVVRVSQLYLTAPQHVLDQPDFLNAACELRTHLSAAKLLESLKVIERALGRAAGGVRYGPRVVDLDMALYGDRGAFEVQTADGPLIVPHKLMLQRTFVLGPLCDIAPEVVHPLNGHTLRKLYTNLCDSELKSDPSARLPQRVMSVREDVTWLLGTRTYVMGILNLTPDSFSDGGRHLDTDVSLAVKAAAEMVKAGADVLDLGAESTRPGAARVTEEEERSRLLPVIKAIRSGVGEAAGWGKTIVLSIDTTRSTIAKLSIEAGADVINDISGGTFDDKMISTAKSLAVPLVLMHTRGTPQTMQSLAKYDNPTETVCDELSVCVKKAHQAGIPPWWLVADPGIGFAKTPDHSMALLRELPIFVDRLVGRDSDLRGSGGSSSSSAGGGGGCCASLVGASRKGFIGQILRQPDPKKRQWGNAATVCAAVIAGADLVRVHEVDEMRQVALLADAVHRGPPVSKL